MRFAIVNLGRLVQAMDATLGGGVERMERPRLPGPLASPSCIDDTSRSKKQRKRDRYRANKRADKESRIDNGEAPIPRRRSFRDLVRSADRLRDLSKTKQGHHADKDLLILQLRQQVLISQRRQKRTRKQRDGLRHDLDLSEADNIELRRRMVESAREASALQDDARRCFV